MRYLLINLHLLLLALYAFVAIVGGGGAVSLLAALGVGGGPAILGTWFIAITLAAVAVVGIVAFIIPLSLVSACNVIFAVACGYRYLRWTRFLGAAVNLAGIAYFLLLPRYVDVIPLEPMPTLIAMLAVNFSLFALIPKRPWRRLTRRIAQAVFVPLYFLPSALIVYALLKDRPDFGVSGYVFVIVLLAGHALLFLYYRRALSATLTINRALAKRLLLCLALSLLGLLLFFPLGIPLFACTLLLFELSEMTLLHPRTRPAPGGFHYRFASILGTPPPEPEDEPQTETPAEKENHDHVNQEEPPVETRA